jgi:hypothetical protein
VVVTVAEVVVDAVKVVAVDTVAEAVADVVKVVAVVVSVIFQENAVKIVPEVLMQVVAVAVKAEAAKDAEGTKTKS